MFGFIYVREQKRGYLCCNFLSCLDSRLSSVKFVAAWNPSSLRHMSRCLWSIWWHCGSEAYSVWLFLFVTGIAVLCFCFNTLSSIFRCSIPRGMFLYSLANCWKYKSPKLESILITPIRLGFRTVVLYCVRKSGKKVALWCEENWSSISKWGVRVCALAVSCIPSA